MNTDYLLLIIAALAVLNGIQAMLLYRSFPPGTVAVLNVVLSLLEVQAAKTPGKWDDQLVKAGKDGVQQLANAANHAGIEQELGS